jgi:hypothetical protein
MNARTKNKEEIIITRASSSHFHAKVPQPVQIPSTGEIITKGSKMSVRPVHVLDWVMEGYPIRVYERLINEEDKLEFDRKTSIRKDLQKKIKDIEDKAKKLGVRNSEIKKGIKNKKMNGLALSAKQCDTLGRELEDNVDFIENVDKKVQKLEDEIDKQGVRRISLSPRSGVRYDLQDVSGSYIGRVFEYLKFASQEDQDEFVEEVAELIRRYHYD